jgi:hypothetical protein
MGETARAGLAFYLRHVTKIRLAEAAWYNDTDKPQNTAEWEDWSEKHARVLARLLQRMPLLVKLCAKWRDWSICQMVGRALLLVPGPLQLTEMEWDYNARVKLPKLFASKDMPCFVAVGMVLGKFPKLAVLDIFDWKFLMSQRNWSLVNSAITLGKLPYLEVLVLPAGDVLELICDTFQTRHRLQEGNIICDAASGPPPPPQAMLKNLQICDFSYSGTGDWGVVQELLELPLFGRLEYIHFVYGGGEGDDKLPEQMEYLADYIQFTEGAPCLLGLGIVCQRDSEEGLGRLADVLANGGA